MPMISLSTNVQLESEDAKRAFVSDFSKFCAETVGKDEMTLNIDVAFNPYLTFGGSFEPATMLHIISLGNVNPTNSQIWSGKFSAYFESKLGVPIHRGLIAFMDPGPAFIGCRGTTVEVLRAQSN